MADLYLLDKLCLNYKWRSPKNAEVEAVGIASNRTNSCVLWTRGRVWGHSDEPTIIHRFGSSRTELVVWRMEAVTLNVSGLTFRVAWHCEDCRWAPSRSWARSCRWSARSSNPSWPRGQRCSKGWCEAVVYRNLAAASSEATRGSRCVAPL